MEPTVFSHLVWVKFFLKSLGKMFLNKFSSYFINVNEGKKLVKGG